MTPRRSILVGAAALAVGCVRSTKPRLPEPLEPKSLHLLPLHDLVPAAGLEYLVECEPARLLRWPAFAHALFRVVPSARWDALATTLGVDVRRADSAAVAGFRDATLYLISVPHEAKAVIDAFQTRLTSRVHARHQGSRILRVEGRLGNEERALIDLDETVVAMCVGSRWPLRAVHAFAERKLYKARPALKAPPLDAVVPHVKNAPLVVYAPRPHDGWVRGANGLLAETLAVGLALLPAQNPTHAVAELHVIAVGAWSGDGGYATSQARRLLEELAREPVARLLGLDAPVAPDIGPEVSGDILRLTRSVNLQHLADGLWAATSAETRELLGDVRHKHPQP